MLRRHWVALGYATGSNLGVRERRGRVGYCGCYFPPWTYKKCELNATLLYQHGGGIVMVRAPYMGLRNCVKAGVYLHPAVSVVSSSLTMSGTVATAVLGVPDLVRLRASQLRCCRAGGYWDLPLLCQCPCAVVAWRPQHESPLLLSPRGERDLFADLPILGGQCCDLESHRCAGDTVVGVAAASSRAQHLHASKLLRCRAGGYGIICRRADIILRQALPYLASSARGIAEGMIL